MRLISAAPRGVTANSRSSATSFGRRFTITSSARSASVSVNSMTSPLTTLVRCFRAGNSFDAPMRTVHDTDTVGQYTIAAAMDQPPYRDVTVGDLLTKLACALPRNEALVYAHGPRFTFDALEREARVIGRGLMALGVERGERVGLWARDVPEWIGPPFALGEI